MRFRIQVILVLLPLLCLIQNGAFAEFKPATIRLEDKIYWVGQRIPFSVELRAAGSFSGAASFSLPEIPQVVILKVGNAVVSSEEMDGESVFVQTHDFALFSQQSGSVDIPAFEVRFSHRDGFTGPVKDEKANVPAARVNVKRPEGSDPNDFLVTTNSLEISETWDQKSNKLKQGDVVHRVITQSAEQVTGMALAPSPETQLTGIRIYADRPEVNDKTERGDFSGHRVDKITYVMQQPGTFTVPAIDYVWWDPDQKKFGSKSLPAVTFTIAALPVAAAEDLVSDSAIVCYVLVFVSFLVVGILVWKRSRVVRFIKSLWSYCHPPDHMAAKRLLKACQRNDATAAELAWNSWRKEQSVNLKMDESLRKAVTEMESVRYGQSPTKSWKGRVLESTFRIHLNESKKHVKRERSDLPALNPVR
ncbi:hypothetical protein Pla110_17820 [Polystyrenella longa]|uniref:DUF7939 domain-containing protein n=1 Tax=Polystyrenella longa TaxID=2528007 RepID=A0A518CLE9_9PLAN|nr:BatD family protein [Polystyrenella longa]QDU80060.1 hypothetical protein Pla110_17820 [Polystyrenella longa]